ncbi:DUF202 domain-containing protein [Pseudoglutamicibacter cumminsii]|uniref:DUF202 domain-containing protein n=1 Tax=Pseudoglutamicibacter cumminsii TaxID=156979 RepID=UPI00195DBA8D|nr:DUF202 domain-containing protein [Pseudoglutamicibacter cumminsii]MBM7796187.1 uncharacterized membrane protein YidH (DUF202 family) [Pseudoglutamicibacter cumminsii]MDZ3744501.1 DUF202 domain-containing protein [Pseudoglutamicibacter cumminsii]
MSEHGSGERRETRVRLSTGWHTVKETGVTISRAVRRRIPIKPPQPLPEPVDVGLQPERTSLAWSRTGFAALVAGFMGVRWYGQMGSLLLVATALTFVGAVWVSTTQRGRLRRMAESFEERQPPPVVPVITMTLMVVGMAVIAIIVVLRV